MEWVSIVVTVLGFGVVLWKFKYERMKIVREVETGARARELDQAKLKSEEKRWAHEQLAEQRLAVLLRVVKFVAACKSLSGVPALMLSADDFPKPEKEKLFHEFWAHVGPAVSENKGNLAKEMMEKHFPLSELKFWYRSRKDLKVMNRFTMAYLAVIGHFMLDEHDIGAWTKLMNQLSDACTAMQKWIRIQLDPTTFAMALDDAAPLHAPEKAAQGVKSVSGNGQHQHDLEEVLK